MRYDNEEWCKIWNRIDLLFWNWHEQFNKCLLEHSKIPKIYTLMCWFWPKYITFQLKKYKGVMFGCTQDWYKVWRKTGLLPKIEKFGEFSTENLKVSKLGPWWHPFV